MEIANAVIKIEYMQIKVIVRISCTLKMLIRM
jgi:hypothetical protein